MTPAGDDLRFMRLALALGRRGQGAVWPNPAVGCVIVKDGRILGRGWTAPGGRPHAEPQALAQAGAEAKGATAYVGLEPCAHHGQTPPCAEALTASGVRRVVTALEDPDPRVAGKGHAILRASGIDVTTGICADEARVDHAGFLLRVTEGRPMVTLKLATSFDGRIATASGESRWITGPGARRMVHALRLGHDAVLVGGGTARADDPDLTVRELGAGRQPVRIVLSRQAHLREGGRLESTARDAPVWVLHGDRPDDVPDARRRRLEDRGVRLLPTAVGPGSHLDPVAALRALGAAGLTRVFCEGGGALAASLLAAGCVDRLVGFTAGVALGAEGRPSLGAMGIDRLSEAPRFRLVAARDVEGDVIHEWARI